MTHRPKTKDPFYQAQAILSRRDHSTFELRQKMQRKKFSAAEIAAAVTQLEHLNLLNDQRFAEQYVRSTLATKAVGPRWLYQKLRLKGIAPDMISSVIAAAYAEVPESEVARQAAERWRRTHPLHAGDTLRLTRFLTARGFSGQAITSGITPDAEI